MPAKARFIPAGAGNTCQPIKWMVSDTVYPRWRGEHHKAPFLAPRNRGLSPLARGTRVAFVMFGGFHRFIPAGAGNTDTRTAHQKLLAVYPRWRGEHDQQCIGNNACCGLSPLARGTLSFKLTTPENIRFIPAGAGNTVAMAKAGKLPAVYPRWRGEHRI